MSEGKKSLFYVKTKENGNWRIDAEQSKLPITPKEHHINYKAMMMIMTSGAIASWAFVTGSSIGVLVPTKYGVCAALFGCTIAIAVIGYMACVYARYGTDMSVIGRSTWGHRGVYVMIIGLGFTTTYGWGSLPMIMLGKSGATFANAIGLPDGPFTTWQLWSFVALGLGLWITYKGTAVIDKVSAIAAPIIVCLILFICFVLAKQFGFSTAWNSLPIGVSGDRGTMVHNYMLAVEVALGVGFSWPFLFSAYTKPATTENAAYTPTIIGSGIMWSLCCVAPCITAVLTGASDPVQALADMGGSYVVIWMIMLLFANFGSVMINPYFLSCSLSAMFPKLKWKYAVAIQAIYAVAIVFPVFYESFGNVICFAGMIEAPAGCIWALDYFVKKKINLRHCYAKGEARKKSAYWYTGGFNPAAWIGVAVGAAFGMWLSNPFTGAIKWMGLFDLFGAMIPASVVGCVVYYLIFRFYQVPRGIGMPDMYAPVEE